MKYLFLLFIILGCEDEQCKPAEAQCDGTVVESCNGDGQWESLFDCADYGEQCCEVAVDEPECLEVCK